VFSVFSVISVFLLLSVFLNFLFSLILIIYYFLCPIIKYVYMKGWWTKESPSGFYRSGKMVSFLWIVFCFAVVRRNGALVEYTRIPVSWTINRIEKKYFLDFLYLRIFLYFMYFLHFLYFSILCIGISFFLYVPFLSYALLLRVCFCDVYILSNLWFIGVFVTLSYLY
jgi:hypothetical protein